MRRAALASLLLVLLFPVHAGGQQAPTLAEVLKRNSVASHLSAVSHLDEAITSYATLNTEREFVIAYYLVTPRNELRFPLLIARFDKRSNKWLEASLSDLKVKTSADTGPATQDDCLGPAVRLEGNGDWYYLDLRLSPSAGCMVVLSHYLSVHQTLSGWNTAMFKSGVLVYEGNLVQSAPVHPATLYLYDPVTRESQKIYPQKRDPFRKEFSGRLAKLIDESRCRDNNWRCDPDEFESSIGQPIEVNDATHALAFRVVYGTQGFIPRDEAAHSGEEAVDRYVYVYQIKPQRWREFSADDVESSFGTDSLKELLTARKLRRVFATPSP
jgi:hypothetical protein